MHIKTITQYLLPQHLLSRLIGKLANTQINWIKKLLITWFKTKYKINLSEALEENPDNYQSFNQFFTRALKPTARPITQQTNTIISPIDGYISQINQLQQQQLIQAKGHYFDLASLLGPDLEQYLKIFNNGTFATLYLSPADYHRVHMPITGTLQQMSHIPGKLFSVNPLTTTEIPQLYAKNERVVTIFDTTIGPLAMVLVGAMLVASIETAWQGLITPSKQNAIKTWNYTENPVHLERGAEMGRFQFGSTVILIFPKNSIEWQKSLILGQAIRFGETLGKHN